MDALTRLQQLLRPSVEVADQPFRHCDTIDQVLADLERRVATGSRPYEPEDHIRKAITAFWAEPELLDLTQARLVCFGLGLPVQSGGLTLFDDRGRFRAVLDSRIGIGQWHGQPRAFRRCYQGLIHSYFSYDPNRPQRGSSAKENWGDLRDYLFERNGLIQSNHAPVWVNLALLNQTLFTSSPCAPYADQLLHGDTSIVDELKRKLGIPESSWFIAELILSQVQKAIRLMDDAFSQHVRRLIAMLEPHILVRDKGLILLLDRYAKQPDQVHNRAMSDAAVSWWGNPWLPSNTAQWGGVSQAARDMVSYWLKHEFVTAFFTKLAEDGYGDTRRMEFWLRYVKSMSHVQFALGRRAIMSRDKDMIVLRDKMKGLTTQLDDGSNNAFIMHLGDLVAVEFSGMGNAFYGYNAKSVPFDVSHPLNLGQYEFNSLKNKNSTIIWLAHQDRIHGWTCWEDMFEATLKEKFGISPSDIAHGTKQRIQAERIVQPVNTSTNADKDQDAPYTWRMVEHLPYAQALLVRLANEDGLSLEDHTAKGGALWVRAKLNDNPDRARVLKRWAFTFVPGKGWYKER